MASQTIILRYIPLTIKNLVERLKKSPLGYRLVNGAFWSLCGAVVSRLFGLAAFVIVARILGKVGYGEFAIVQSTVGMFGIFAGFGLGQTATKYVAELRDKNPEKAGRIMGMSGLVAAGTGIAMATILFVFAPWLASNTLANPGLATPLRIGSLILFAEALNGAQLGALSGFEAFKAAAKINIVVGIITFPAMMWGVYAGGLEGSIWALVGIRALNWLLNHIILRREAAIHGVPFTIAGSLQEFPILWHFSLPAMLSSVMVFPTLWLCNAMLVNQPGGYGQMGLLQAALVLQQVILFAGANLGAPLLPILANSIGNENKGFARINMLSTWFLGVVPAVFLFGIPEIAIIIYGNDFAGQQFVKTFLLIVFSTSIIVYKQGLARVLAAYGLMWWGTLSNLFWALTMISFTWLLIGWGALGFALAYVLAYVLNTVVFIPLYISKHLVPKGTIISLEAGVIWSLLLAGLSFNFFNLPLAWRLVFIPFSLCITCWMFMRLLKYPWRLAHIDGSINE